MNKIEFFTELRKRLSKLPQEDIEERISFYSEMIDDRMEEGLSEEEAVSAVGSIDEIVAQIVTDTPLAREKATPKRQLKAWAIVLLALGSPIWLSLGIAAFAIILSIYIVLWSVIISLWAVFASLVGCVLGFIACSIVFACTGHGLSGIAAIGAGLVCAGLSVFMFYGSKATTKGLFTLTATITQWIKNRFIGKEEVS